MHSCTPYIIHNLTNIHFLPYPCWPQTDITILINTNTSRHTQYWTLTPSERSQCGSGGSPGWADSGTWGRSGSTTCHTCAGSGRVHSARRGEVGAAHRSVTAWVAGILDQNAALWDDCVDRAALSALVATTGRIQAFTVVFAAILPSSSPGIGHPIEDTEIWG